MHNLQPEGSQLRVIDTNQADGNKTSTTTPQRCTLSVFKQKSLKSGNFPSQKSFESHISGIDTLSSHEIYG